VVVGEGADGNQFTLFVRPGNVLVRITVVGPGAPAEDVARTVANAVLAKRA
jgi:hypothetical protein